ncbi:unnamed protein product, partial [Effrenium voratum]
GQATLPRMLRVASAPVQLMEEPSRHAQPLPWVVQQPGAVVLTSGRASGDWVELLFAHLRTGWAPLRAFAALWEAGCHGDAAEDAGGMQNAIQSHQSAMLRVALAPGLASPLEPLPSFRLEQRGQQAHVWLPDDFRAPLPLLIVLHGSRP